MKKPIKDLENMVGKTYMFKKKNIMIKGFIIDRDSQIINIKTTGEPIDVSLIALPEFIKNCLEVEEENEIQVTSTEVIIPEKSKSEIVVLREILMDNINKVRENKEYIEQAKSINNNINTLINMYKLELQISKEKKK
jgi:hypothetical protein